jgi:hypothetical protein
VRVLACNFDSRVYTPTRTNPTTGEPTWLKRKRRARKKLPRRSRPLNSTSAEYCSALVESNHQEAVPAQAGTVVSTVCKSVHTDQNKRRAAQAALSYVRDATCVGVGTGIHRELFHRGACGSARSHQAPRCRARTRRAARLRAAGIDVIDLNDAGPIDVYVDGADEATRAASSSRAAAALSPAKRSSPPRRAASCASSMRAKSSRCLESFRCPSK